MGSQLVGLYLWKVCNKKFGDKNHENWFEKGVRWKVENGKEVKFWLDKWVGDECLQNSFARLVLN